MGAFIFKDELDDRTDELNKCLADLGKIRVLISQATGDLGAPQVQQPPLCFVEVLAWQADGLDVAEELASFMLALNEALENLFNETQGLRTRIESGVAAPSPTY